jgi:thiol-disulfide isomerase/thioredoxin
VNETTPGQKLELEKYVVKGKTTLFEFYSGHCPACDEMAPILKYLSRRRAGLAIRQVLIDRPNATEIDFDSPLAEQYRLQTTPSFQIHDPSGALIAEGKAAKALVRAWYQEAQAADQTMHSLAGTDRYPGAN